MATRFYYDSATSPSVSPSFSAEWDTTPSAIRRVLNAARGSSALADFSANEISSSTSNLDILIAQFVSEPIGVTNFNGMTIKGRIRAFETNALANHRAQVIVKLVPGDGSGSGTVVYAGDLTTGSTDPTSEFVLDVLTNRQFPRGASVNCANVTSANGDRIVVEVGYRAHNTRSNIFGAAIRIGENDATPLPEDETTTTDNHPWIEFSGTIEAYSVPVEKSASDSGVVSGSETATVAASRTANDSGTVSSAEVATTNAAIASSDTGTVSGADATAIAAQIAASDSGSVTGTESVSIAEFLDKNTEDAGVVSGAESVGIAASVPASDSGAISGSESAATTAQVSRADSGIVAAAESFSINVRATDAGVVHGVDVASLTNVTSRADAGIITGSEAASVTAAIPKSDSGVVSSSDVVSLAVSRTVVDGGIVGGAEAASTSTSRTVIDSGGVTGAEQVSVAASSTVVDSASIMVDDAASVLVAGLEKSASDSGTVAASETAFTSAAQQRLDSGVVSIAESVSINKNEEPVSAHDSGIVSTEESLGIVARINPWLPGEPGNTINSFEDAWVDALTPVSDSGSVTVAESVFVQKIGEPLHVADSGQIGALESASVRAYIQVNVVENIGSDEFVSRVWVELLTPTGQAHQPGVFLPGSAGGIFAAGGTLAVVGLGTPGINYESGGS